MFRFLLLAIVAAAVAGFAPAPLVPQQSKLARSKLLTMCDAAVAEEAAEEEKGSVLDSLSDGNAALLETIKGMTLMEVADLIKEVDNTFHFGDEDEEEEAAEEAPAEE